MPASDKLPEINGLMSLFRIDSMLFLIIGMCILIYTAKWVKRLSTLSQESYPNLRLSILQFSTVFTFIWYIFGSVIVVYASLRPPKEAIIGVATSAGLAIGLSLKDLVSSLIAGVVLLFDRPFQVGDRVSFGSIYGEITHIGLRAVKLVTLDDNLVTIPNSEFMNEAVASGNAGELDMMIEIKFHLDLHAPIEEVREGLYEIVITSRYAYLKKPVAVVIKEEVLGNQLALLFTVKAYVFDIHYEKAFETDIITRGSQFLNKNSYPRPRFATMV